MPTTRRPSVSQKCVHTFPPRVHLSATEHPTSQWVHIKSVRQQVYDFKCEGFWYGYKDHWLQHLQREDPLYGSAYVPKQLWKVCIPPCMTTALHAKHPHKILVLRTRNDLLRFADTYAKKQYTKKLYNTYCSFRLRDSSYSVISMTDAEETALEKRMTKFKYDYQLVRWQNVANDFGGIEIQNWNTLCEQKRNTPLWDPRLGWCDDWDLSSGCVWDRTILKHIRSNIQLFRVCSSTTPTRKRTNTYNTPNPNHA